MHQKPSGGVPTCVDTDRTCLVVRTGLGGECGPVLLGGRRLRRARHLVRTDQAVTFPTLTEQPGPRRIDYQWIVGLTIAPNECPIDTLSPVWKVDPRRERIELPHLGAPQWQR